MDAQFISYTLKQMMAALIALSASFPATATPPVTPIEVQGMKSNVHMIYKQDMLGTGEYPDANPLLTINPVNPQGAVRSTTTIEVVKSDPVVTFTAPTYKICSEYPTGGAPSNVKCGN